MDADQNSYKFVGAQAEGVPACDVAEAIQTRRFSHGSKVLEKWRLIKYVIVACKNWQKVFKEIFKNYSEFSSDLNDEPKKRVLLTHA